MNKRRMYYISAFVEYTCVYSCHLSQDSLGFMLQRLPVKFPGCHMLVSRDPKA